jgi:hypothetical protein
VKGLAIIMLLAGVADARGHRCYDEHAVVGYEHCTRFGQWGGGAPMFWDFGASFLTFDPGTIDQSSTTATASGAQSYHVVSTDTRAVHAAGGEFRATIGFPGALYLAMDFAFATVTSGPHLVATTTDATGTTMMTGGEATGTVMQSTIGLGISEHLGAMMIRSELAPGFRFVALDGNGATAQVPALVVMAREHADLWITPTFTLGVMAGIDLVHRDDYTLGVSLGLHLTPFGR